MTRTRPVSALIAVVAAAAIAVGATPDPAAHAAYPTSPEAVVHPAGHDPEPTAAEVGADAEVGAEGRSIEEALAGDLGLTMEQFVEAGALAEQAAPLVADAGGLAVGVLRRGEVVVRGGNGSIGTDGSGTEEATASFADLEELRESYLSQVGPEGLTGLAYTATGYEVRVIDPDEVVERGRTDAVGPLLSPTQWAAQHPGVETVATTGPTTPAATVRGGAGVEFGSVICSWGFNGWYNGDGRGISAGHCPYAGGGSVSIGGSTLGTVDWWQFGAPGSAWESWGTDLATVDVVAGHSYPASVTTYASTVTVTGQAAPVVGMPVCKSGRRTGWTCTRVRSVGWQWIGDGSGDINRPKRWVWSLFADTRVVPGDSGGPWVSGHKAVGITSSYDSYADGSPYATASLVTDLDDWRPGAEVAFWLGRASLPSARYADALTGRARWSTGQTVSGRLTRQSGDSVAPGTVMDVRVDGSLVTSPAVAADGAFSFTYPGSDTAAHTVTLRARNGDSRGSTVTITEDPASAGPAVVRHSGPNRYATAADVALDTFAAGRPVVYLASGQAFPDALSGGALAGKQGVPVLLTRADGLPSVTASALRTLAPARVVVLGGTVAVSETVADQVRALGLPVERMDGKDRYAVAARVASTYPADVHTVFVASGVAFPDALSAASRAGATDSPVLLTRPDGLPADTAAAIERLSPSRIVLVGGPAAVGAPVETQLRALATTVVRIDGANRYEVAARLARLYPVTGASAWLASGTDFPDALAAAPAAATKGVPLVLTRPDALTSAAAGALLRLEAPTVRVAGGPVAVSSATAEAVRWLDYR
ncbi:cell wall-binding repeat-containing protein [Ornithinimicrobium sp. W1679]|uniref:cell wall-binding repeat-containing protein n=1 Tax=Ornithinimicrobium sp. W1679 TaxID=3418770 RepID=UPI003CF5A8DC